ncbi:protein FAR1-RELATED SEQUENCE 1-like [Actinidia eriantha]|uniref:protein FAR1-RELATED SEQUENCE 1-like n=1 Tax=Actinidia eriantha TaxID=165200 RepID=UPI00258E4E78|nr:protein FAR1-RELATED SEQUENCE 1-like [Actinidia eriantha]
MQSTQLSESLNAKIKRSLKFDLNIVQFFTLFDKIVVEKRYEESKAIYNSREKLPQFRLKKSPLLIQVLTLYTPPIFDLFRDVVDNSLCCKVKQCHVVEGQFQLVITLHGNDVEYVVVGSVEVDDCENNILQSVHCTCRKFEYFRILCVHAIKGLDRMSIMEIPESYVLGRWRLEAKYFDLKESKHTVVENDPKLLKASRFRIICPQMVKLATQSCELEEAYLYVEEMVKHICEKVGNMILGIRGLVGRDANELEHNDHQYKQVKGLKKKKGIPMKGRRRLKPWHEKTTKRRKIISQSTNPSKGTDHLTNSPSTLSSSKASYDQQTSQVMTLREADSFLDNNYFFSLLSEDANKITL